MFRSAVIIVWLLSAACDIKGRERRSADTDTDTAQYYIKDRENRSNDTGLDDCWEDVEVLDLNHGHGVPAMVMATLSVSFARKNTPGNRTRPITQ